MNELDTRRQQLPDTIEDLAKFALVGREKLNAVRAEIRAIQKVGLAREVREQKLREGQEIGEMVLDAEARIGELTAAIQGSQGKRSDIQLMDNTVHKSAKTKKQVLQDAGITQRQAQRYEQLAAHPQQLAEAKEAARAEGRIPTRQDVMDRIIAAAPKRKTVDDLLHEKAKESETRLQEIDKEIRENEVVDISLLHEKNAHQGLVDFTKIEDGMKTLHEIQRQMEKLLDLMESLLAYSEDDLRKIFDPSIKTSGPGADDFNEWNASFALERFQSKADKITAFMEEKVVAARHEADRQRDGAPDRQHDRRRAGSQKILNMYANG